MATDNRVLRQWLADRGIQPAEGPALIAQAQQAQAEQAREMLTQQQFGSFELLGGEQISAQQQASQALIDQAGREQAARWAQARWLLGPQPGLAESGAVQNAEVLMAVSPQERIRALQEQELARVAGRQVPSRVRTPMAPHLARESFADKEGTSSFFRVGDDLGRVVDGGPGRVGILPAGRFGPILFQQKPGGGSGRRLPIRDLRGGRWAAGGDIVAIVQLVPDGASVVARRFTIRIRTGCPLSDTLVKQWIGGKGITTYWITPDFTPRRSVQSPAELVATGLDKQDVENDRKGKHTNAGRDYRTKYGGLETEKSGVYVPDVYAPSGKNEYPTGQMRQVDWVGGNEGEKGIEISDDPGSTRKLGTQVFVKKEMLVAYAIELKFKTEVYCKKKLIFTIFWELNVFRKLNLGDADLQSRVEKTLGIDKLTNTTRASEAKVTAVIAHG